MFIVQFFKCVTSNTFYFMKKLRLFKQKNTVFDEINFTPEQNCVLSF